jgi:hypothetical protein
MPLYAPPPAPAFPAGAGELPAGMNSLVQAPLGFCTQGIFFRAEQHTAQTVSATTFTIVTYDTIPEDPYSGWNATSHRWLAPYTGWYEITLGNNVTAAVDIAACVLVTGTTRTFLAQQQAGFGAGGANGSIILPLIGTEDYVQGQIWTNPGATLDTNTGRYSSLEIAFVSQ